MSDLPRADLFARVAPFAPARPASLARLASACREERLRSRAVLWTAGAEVADLLLVRGGVLRESVDGVGDRDLCLGFVGRGEVAGEGPALAALVGPTTHHTALVVHEEATVWRLPLAALLELMHAEPEVGLRLGALCAQRRREVEARLAGLVFHPVEARLAWALGRLAARFGVRDSRGVIVNLRLTHRDLAALAGSSRESASVVLTAWRRAGVVAAEGRRVVVLDEERLASLAKDPPEAHGPAVPVAADPGRTEAELRGAAAPVGARRRRRRPTSLYSRA